jgi:hypothetical protein
MVNHKIILSYRNVYGQDFEGDVNALLEGIDEIYAFNLIGILNENLDNYNTTNTLIAYLAENWFSHQNAEQLQIILNGIRANEGRFPECELVIFNEHTTLAFTELLITYVGAHPDQVEQRPTYQQMETNFLNIYLHLNQTLNKSENGHAILKETFPEEHSHWLFLYKPFQTADLINTKPIELFITENAKAILLFQHLSDNPATRPIIEAFLVKYDCGTWNDYLSAISGMSVTGLDTANHRGNSLVHIDQDLPYFATCIKILDHMSVQIDDATFAEDYLFLRNHPVYRTAYDKFQILSQRFFLERIFRGLYFELKEINSQLGLMSNNQFRTQVYTTGYSENKLLYKVLNTIFSGTPNKKEGATMEDIDPGFGASDYIAHHKGSVFLFESKDILIKKEVKDRLQIPEMREEFRKKFYKDGNGDKAVLQLAKNIKKLMDGQYEKFGFNLGKYRFIYPIIVVHSDAFNILGINQLLYQWFKEACIEAGISKNQLFKVRPVVLVDVSTLLYFQEHINKKGTGLDTLIEMYLTQTTISVKNGHGAVSTVGYESKYLLPFSFFINRTIRSLKSFRNGASLIAMMREFLIPKKR